MTGLVGALQVNEKVTKSKSEGFFVMRVTFHGTLVVVVGGLISSLMYIVWKMEL